MPACHERVPLGSGVPDDDGTDGVPILPWFADDDFIDEIPIDNIACKPGLTTDLDGDGYSAVQGDCNDCDPDMGPNAVEMVTLDGEMPKDENCNGLIDEATPLCDSAVALDDSSAIAAARAVDLCRIATPGSWGVASALWRLPNGSTPPSSTLFALGHGVLNQFGPNVLPQRGAQMLALSTGAARRPGDVEYISPAGFDKGYTSAPPESLAQTASACSSGVPESGRDGIALEIQLGVPQNAQAFAFDFNFFTFEMPASQCTAHGDRFAAVLTPAPFDSPTGNIAFDSAGGIVRASSVFFEACTCPTGPPCYMGGQAHACSLGSDSLLGNGFGADLSGGNHAATGWLTSTAEVEAGGHFTLRFMIYDATDGLADSTVLIDNFRWLHNAPQIPRSHQ